MRVYQFMPARYAVEDLRKRRLKVSLLDDLNDPFEMLGARLDLPEQRKTMRAWAKYMADTTRLLCFSRRYVNTMLWSHYADKHRGICLAFDAPKKSLLDVAYSKARLELDFNAAAGAPDGVDPLAVRRLLTTTLPSPV